MNYRIRPGLQVGVEYNPLDDDLGLLANWRALDETATRPALMLGTSSDRIGTSDGRAYFATLSKSLDRELGLPIAPYAGVTFGESDDQWRGIGGVNIRYAPRWNSTHLYDGKNTHHILTHVLGSGRSVGLMLAEQDGSHFVGVTFGTALGF